MANLDSVLRSRDITLPTDCLVKAMVFPVVIYECESWTIKKAAAAAKSLQSCLTVQPHRRQPTRLRAEELMLLNCGVGENS